MVGIGFGTHNAWDTGAEFTDIAKVSTPKSQLSLLRRYHHMRSIAGIFTMKLNCEIALTPLTEGKHNETSHQQNRPYRLQSYFLVTDPLNQTYCLSHGFGLTSLFDSPWERRNSWSRGFIGFNLETPLSAMRFISNLCPGYCFTRLRDYPRAESRNLSKRYPRHKLETVEFC